MYNSLGVAFFKNGVSTQKMKISYKLLEYKMSINYLAETRVVASWLSFPKNNK